MRRVPPRLATALRYGLLLALVAGLGLALAQQWAEVRRSLAELDPALLVAAFLAAVAAVTMTMLSWRQVLAELGSPLPVRPAASIFLVGQLGKYLPGSVWPLVTQTAMAAERGVPRLRTVTAGLLGLGIGVITGALVGLPAVAVLVPGAGGVTLAVVGVPLLLATLHPRLLTLLLNTVARLARRPPLERPLGLRGLALAEGWALLAAVAYGLQAYLLLRGLAPGASVGAVTVVSAFSLAVVAGILFLPAPAGAGAREGALLLVLGPQVGIGPAGALALVSRLVMTVADAVTAGGAALSARSHPRGAAGATDPPPGPDGADLA